MSHNTSDKPAQPDPGAPPGSPLEETLRPFQAASARFLQTSQSVQQSIMRQSVQTWLDFVDQVRKTEYEAHRTAMAAARKHLDAMGQAPTKAPTKALTKALTSSPEELFAARAQAQADYEQEVRQIQADTQTKLAALSQSTFGASGSGSGSNESIQQLSNQRQDAYQAYLADLQQAWSGVKSLDPQTVSAIASTILFTMNAAGHGG